VDKRQRGVCVPELEAVDLTQIYMASEALENLIYENACGAPEYAMSLA